MTEITDKTLEMYKNVHDDLSKMRDEILTALAQHFDETQGNREAVEELRRIILEYDLPASYNILTKEELGHLDVALRPPFRVGFIERPELQELTSTTQNVFIIGKPGVGKTFLLYQMAKRLSPEKLTYLCL